MSDSRTGTPRSIGASGTKRNLLIETISDVMKGVAGAVGRPAFNAAKGVFKIEELNRAHRNVERYLSGEGGVMEYDDEDISSHPFLKDSLSNLRSYFETRTFTANTGKEDVKDGLTNLKDGEKFVFNDYWDKDVENKHYLNKIVELGYDEFKDENYLDRYLAEGSIKMGGDGSFVAERRGDDLFIDGNVEYRIGSRNSDEKMEDEVYDFNYMQPGGWSAVLVEYAEDAKPFTIRYVRHQPVRAKLKYGPDNELTIDSVTWGPLQ